jgi:CheY-like chemotaxis protein
MAKKTDINTLFLAQISSHAEELVRLLAAGPTDPIDPNTVERAILSTTMLANSTSLMDLPALHDFLRAFEELLGIYRDKKLPWDEKIAQLTSEIIEREERLVAGGKGKGAAALKAAISDADVNALNNELEDVRSYASTASPPPPVQEAPAPRPEPVREPPAAAPAPARQAPVAAPAPVRDASAPAASPPAASERETGPARTATPKTPVPTPDVPLGSSVRGLNDHVEGFLNRWGSSSWSLGNLEAGMVDQVRRDLFLAAFHALAVEQMLGIKTANRDAPRTDSLADVAATLQDFSRVLCSGTDRSIDIKLIGENNRIDVRLLHPVVRILQNMIGDVSLRCKEAYLRVEIIAQEQNGSLIWSLRDNGDNFISDTRLDPDEYLAFYPSLRETRKILTELRSLLWVEPDESHDTRFAFSVPLSLDGGAFVVWERGDRSFAVPSSQVSDIMTLDDVEPRADGQGEYVSRDGGRIAVVRLDQIFGGGDLKGDRIVIIGQLEKRVAFYVEGPGEVVNGTWLKDAVPPWRGHRQGVVRFGERKVTVVEAEDLLDRYHKVVGDLDHESMTGAASEPMVAAADEKADTPRDAPRGGEAKAHVLIVEKSEAMRNALASILSSKGQIRTTFVDELEAAIERLRKDTPSLIISEFRVPSMAAKVIADRLRAEGKDIPVVVTTTQGGEQAELLVEKIGVAGYITKPLNSADVLGRIESLLHGRPAAAPRA